MLIAENLSQAFLGFIIDIRLLSNDLGWDHSTLTKILQLIAEEIQENKI